MSATRPMTPLRRRPMPGMPAAPPAAPADGRTDDDQDRPSPAMRSAAKRSRRTAQAPGGAGERTSPRRYPVVNYSATHVANFRLPVDLHARYGRLLAEARELHPRLRKMSLTEVVIALLVEGPQTPDEVAELVRRKRADEHGEETQR